MWVRQETGRILAADRTPLKACLLGERTVVLSVGPYTRDSSVNLSLIYLKHGRAPVSALVAPVCT
jgi:hypothetical protein